MIINGKEFEEELFQNKAILESFQEKLDTGKLWDMPETTFTRQIADELLLRGLIVNKGIMTNPKSRIGHYL